MPAPRDLARLQALGRIAAGAALTLAPGRASAGWLGRRDARRPPTRVAVAAMGARDLALGVGQARAVASGFGATPWVLAGLLADAADLAATWRARDELPTGGATVVLAVAGGSTALGLWLARAVD